MDQESLLRQVDSVDPSDLRALGELHTAFESLASDGPESASAALRRAAARIEDAILGGDGDGRLLDELRAIVASTGEGPETDGDAADEERAGLVEDFLSESREHLARAEEHLLVLEGDPSGAEELNAVFRAYHTIKGIASFLGYSVVRGLAHEAESLLSDARAGRFRLAGDAFEAILETNDLLGALFDAIEATGSDASAAIEPDSLIERLRSLRGEPTPEARCPGAAPTGARAGDQPGPEARKYVRIERADLDKLSDLVGELLQSYHRARLELERGGRESRAAGDALARAVHRIQGHATSLRLVPLGPTLKKMKRLVRDLSRSLGKPLRLVLSGEETALDRSIVERIGDPLVHIVRNAADHGIEPSVEERIRAGKEDVGTIAIRSARVGDSVTIEVGDDGAGIDLVAVASRARQRGLLGEDARKSPEQILDLIFEPGFSTAEAVTNVSGRGVGMDVVRREVERLHGHIEISSEKGQGTTCRLRFPLTISIVRALLVQLGVERYLVPIDSVDRAIRLEDTDRRNLPAGRQVLRDGERSIPVLDLCGLLGVAAGPADPGRRLVLVVQAGSRRAALVFDEVLDELEVVLTGLDSVVDRLLAGGAILPDGTVGLVLDVPAIVEASHHALAPAGSQR